MGKRKRSDATCVWTPARPTPVCRRTLTPSSSLAFPFPHPATSIITISSSSPTLEAAWQSQQKSRDLCLVLWRVSPEELRTKGKRDRGSTVERIFEGYRKGVSSRQENKRSGIIIKATRNKLLLKGGLKGIWSAKLAVDFVRR